MNERDIFLAALEKHDPGERTAYLDDTCRDDAALRRRVETLLYAHAIAGSFLEHPAVAQVAAEADVQREFTQPLTPSGEADSSGTQAEEPSTDGLTLDFLKPSEKADSLGRLGHYEVLEVVGRGGMGVVLKAFDDELHRVVAIKVMAAPLGTNATGRQRFRREAQAAAAISHDHVVTIHAVEEADGLPYLVMQYVRGVSLQERLDRTGPLEVKEVLRIGMQAASGLAAAHAQGIVHRDVKPANILLENGVERVRITDFGLARAVDDASVTQSGMITGTPMYMAPEQAAGEVVDHRADLFSLGSVLYALCTGRPPFRASGTMAVLKRVCEDAPRPIQEINPDIPGWLCAVVEKLHAKTPEDRFQSAKEVADLLEQHLAHLQQPSKVPQPAPVVKPPAAEAVQPDGSDEDLLSRGLRFVLTVAAVGFVVQLLFLGYWATRGRLFHWAVVASAGGLGLAPFVWILSVGLKRMKRYLGAAYVWRKFTPLLVALLVLGLALLALPFVSDWLLPEKAYLTVEREDPSVVVVLVGQGDRFEIPLERSRNLRYRPGEYTIQGYKDGKAYFYKTIMLPPGETRVVTVARPADDPGWVQLFNGKDLAGWTGKFPDAWSIENGVLIGRGNRGSPKGWSELIHAHYNFQNLHLRVEAKINATGWASLRVRKQKDSYFGYKIWLSNDPDNTGARTGRFDVDGGEGNFKVTNPPERFPSLVDEWFTLDFIAQGPELELQINGREIGRTTDASFARGEIQLEVAGANTVVHFRKIEIKELPPGGKSK